MPSTSDSFVIDPSQISIHVSDNFVYMSLPIFGKLGVCKHNKQEKHADLSCSSMVQWDNWKSW